MPILTVTDISDPVLDPYARLTEHQLRCRKNPENAVFIAESRTVVTLAWEAGYIPCSLLIESGQLSGAAHDLVERISTAYPTLPIYTADNALLSTLTGFALSRGVIGVFRRPTLPTVEEICAKAHRIAVLEDIMDATNVGAIFRSAAGLGMDALLVTSRCSDPLLRRSARVSMGTVFQIPWTVIGETYPTQTGSTKHWSTKNWLDILHDFGFVTAAMALSHDTLTIDDPRLKAAEKLAILLGTEGTGLRPETIAQADYTVKIPMYHDVDSLNVAAASAVAFWEIRKK